MVSLERETDYSKEAMPIMEAVYWYNITSRDNVSPLTAPANWVQLKGINALPPDEPKQLQIGYDVGNCVWIKTLIGWWITSVISPENILDDSMHRHVRDLHPGMGSNTLESGSDNKLSAQRARTIIINDARSDLLGVGNQDATADTSADESSKEEITLPWRSARRKKPAPVCYLCDHQIMGEFSGIERQNEQPIFVTAFH